MAAMPWKFESSYPHHTLPKALYGKSFIFGVVAQLIERYVRIVEVVGLSPISSTRINIPTVLLEYFLFSIVAHVIMGLQLLNYKSRYCCLEYGVRDVPMFKSVAIFIQKHMVLASMIL